LGDKKTDVSGMMEGLDLDSNSEENREQIAFLSCLMDILIQIDLKRQDQGLSYKALAKKVGVSPKTISRWLSLDYELAFTDLCSLASAVGFELVINIQAKTNKSTDKI